MSGDSYRQIFEEQDGRCAICKRKSDKRLHVDHHHESGKPRGLLCVNCNIGIGNFFEDVISLENAIKYLREFA